MERLRGAKIIVTGGAGFIGSHLAKKLIQKHAYVWIVDNNYTQQSYRSFEHDLKFAEKVFLDIRNRSSVMREIKKIHPNYIYHLAAEAIVTDSFENPYRTFQTNIMGTVNILETVRSLSGINGVIVASSDKAYGKTKTTYTEDSPLKGDHPYDVSKSSADLIAQTYVISYKLPVIVTRFGNVYGEGDFHFDRVIPGICQAFYCGKDFEIRSNGKFIRDYLYVDDVVGGYTTLLEKFNIAIGQAYNFSSSDTLSVLELLKKFEKILHNKIPYRILNNSNNEIPYQHLDDKKIKKLGWKQQYSLSQTLEKVYKWYAKALSKKK